MPKDNLYVEWSNRSKHKYRVREVTIINVTQYRQRPHMSGRVGFQLIFEQDK